MGWHTGRYTIRSAGCLFEPRMLNTETETGGKSHENENCTRAVARRQCGRSDRDWLLRGYRGETGDHSRVHLCHERSRCHGYGRNWQSNCRVALKNDARNPGLRANERRGLLFLNRNLPLNLNPGPGSVSLRARLRLSTLNRKLSRKANKPLLPTPLTPPFFAGTLFA